MKVIPKKSWCDVVDAIQLALSDPSRLGDARALLERKGMTKAIDLFDRFQDSLHSYSAFPRQQWKRLRTSNMLERINGGHATPERFPTTGRCSVLQWPF